MTTSPLPFEACLDIRLVYLSTHHILAFTNARIICYFVMRTGDDGLPFAEMKSVIVHHVAFITVDISRILMELLKKCSLTTLFISTNCLSEIKKSQGICIYKLSVAVGQQE